MLHLSSPAQSIQRFRLLSSKQNIFHLFVFSDSPEDQSNNQKRRGNPISYSLKFYELRGFGDAHKVLVTY